MKKLIILGGNPETKQLVEFANSLGVFTIVIDPNPSSTAKKIASKSYNFDGFDVENIVKTAKEEDVDGILVGVADILVKPYYEICQKLNFPCYATKGAIEYLSNKANFNKLCELHSVKFIPYFKYEDIVKDDFDKFPIVIKPVDNGGGVGIEVCEKKEDFGKMYQTALNASKRKIILIERYMNCDDMFAYYTIQGGKIYLSIAGDRITKQITKNSTPVCILAKYPSKHIDKYIKYADNKIKRMIENLNIKNGILNIQFFKEDNNFFTYDPGFRLQGEGMHFYLKEINGFDHREMLINFALNGKFGESIENLNDPFLHKKRAYTIWLLLDSGKIDKIEGIEEIKREKSIIHIVQRFYEGDKVDKTFLGTEKQVFCRIYVVVDSKDEAVKTVEKIRQKVHVYNKMGKEMIFDFYNTILKEVKDG